MSEWKKVRLGEVCDVRDGTHASPKEASSGRLLLTSKNLIGGRLSFEKAYLISNDDADEIDKRSKVDQWDVLFSMIGTVGEIAVVKERPEFAIKNVGLFKTNGNKELAHWVYYYFRSPIGKMQVYERLQGTTQQYITLGQLREFPIPLPPLPTQRKIAAVLGALDDKIENNRKICANLEAQAQAIFKSWFVDFEPFGGKMPQGWKILPLESVCFNIRDRVGFEGAKERKVLSAIADGKLVLSEEYFTKQVYSKEIGKYIIVNEGDFAYNPARINIGSIGINDLGVGGCVSPVYVSIRVDKEYRNFFKLFFKTTYFAEEVRRRAIGSVRQLLSYPDFGMISCVYPTREYIKKFNHIYEVIVSGQRTFEHESRSLAATRDALLPKLMSGEIDVEKVEVA